MDGDYDLRDFDNVCRLFPLPKVVLFPHAVLPLHIFEPRYRQMTEDALEGDKLVTIVQWRAPFPTQPGVEPSLEKIACLGRIIQHERLPDGGFNFLLLGRKRVRLGREIRSDKLYRLCTAEILEDENGDLDEGDRLETLTSLFRKVFERHGQLDPDLKSLLESGLPLATLTDLVSHAMGLPPGIKQDLLAETRVDRRADILAEILEQIASRSHPDDQGVRPFPPPFSMN